MNQVILISGESGAGKTETAKLLLSMLLHYEKEQTSFLQRQILESVPLLEAFGNAGVFVRLFVRSFNRSFVRLFGCLYDFVVRQFVSTLDCDISLLRTVGCFSTVCVLRVDVS
jgi:ABC-type Na+ transport system ATPase subunit NatA